MGGLLAIAVLVLYIWIWKKVFGRIQPVWGKALAFVLAILIPTGDAIYGRIVLNQMCEAEGGLRVYKTVENVDGFFDDHGPDERWIKNRGFTFAEGRSQTGSPNVDRLSKDSDGMVTMEKNVPRKSIYRLRFVPGELGSIYRRNKYVLDTYDETEILGEEVDISYSGGWVERAINGIYAAHGTAGTCGLSIDVSRRRQDLVAAALRPSKI